MAADTSLNTCNNFVSSASGQSYSKLVSSGVTGAGAGPGVVAASNQTVTGSSTAVSPTFLTTFAVGDVIRVTATSEPQVITAIASNTSLTTDKNFASSTTGSAYTAF